MARAAVWSWLLGLMLCLGGWPSTTWADGQRLQACIVAAANYRHQDPLLLKAISYQESGFRLDAVNHNRDKNGKIKSTDHGPFQINSQWLPKLKKHGITEAQLYDPCVSAHVAAWLLSDAIKRYGSTWRAVGAYNSPTEPKQKIYATLVKKHYTRFRNERQRELAAMKHVGEKS